MTSTANFNTLIVDDHQALRAALRGLVQSAYPGANIHEAGDGAQALAQCQSQRPR